MAKRQNNLLGVGGQRRKLSRSDQGSAPARAADRAAAADQKQELLRKMRERVQPGQTEETEEETAGETEGTTEAEPLG